VRNFKYSFKRPAPPASGACPRFAAGRAATYGCGNEHVKNRGTEQDLAEDPSEKGASAHGVIIVDVKKIGRIRDGGG
jgi:hypothetical protein